MEYFPDLYEKYIDIFNKYNNQDNPEKIPQRTYCNLIEILLRIKNNNDVKYHFNYDNYFLNKFDI